MTTHYAAYDFDAIRGVGASPQLAIRNAAEEFGCGCSEEMFSDYETAPLCPSLLAAWFNATGGWGSLAWDQIPYEAIDGELVPGFWLSGVFHTVEPD